MVLCKSTAEEVSFEWSHHRSLSTDSKIRTTVRVYNIIDSRVKRPRHETDEKSAEEDQMRQ